MQTPELNPMRTLTYSHGISWLVQSLLLLKKQSGRLLLIAVLMQFILGLTQVPLIGLLVIMSVPGFTAGILQAFHVTRQGGRPTANLLFMPFTSRSHAGKLFAMGALIFIIGLLSVSLMLSGTEQVISPDLMSRIEQGDVEAVTELDQGTLGKLVIAFMVGIAISGTLSYFTIPLIWFHGRKLVPSLVDGLKALVVNWRPFLALALGLMALMVPVGIVAGVLFGLATGGGILAVVMMGLMLVLILAFQMVLFGTQYCSFIDVFGINEGPGLQTVEDDNQLVA